MERVMLGLDMKISWGLVHLTKFGRFIGEDFFGDDGSILFLGITG